MAVFWWRPPNRGVKWRWGRQNRDSWPISGYQIPSYLHFSTCEMMFVWRNGNIEENCHSVLTQIVGHHMVAFVTFNWHTHTQQLVHKGMRSSYRPVDCIWLWSCLVNSLSFDRLCVFGFHDAYLYINFFLLTSYSLSFGELSLVGLAIDTVD